MEIREATLEDAETVARILRASFAEYESLYTPDAYVATTAVEIVRARLAEGATWLALSDGVAVGTISATATPKGLHSRGMAVVPEARGRGVADALMETVEDFAQAQHLRRERK